MNLDIIIVEPDNIVHIYRNQDIFVYFGQVLCDHRKHSPGLPIHTDGK